MRLSTAAHLLLLLRAPGATHQVGGVPDCQLNGVAPPGGSDAHCVCDKGWKGPACGELDLVAEPTVAYGVGSPLTENHSSWGGGPPVYDGAQWHLFVSEIAAHCGMQCWSRLSQATHAVSASPTGPYRRRGVIIGTQTHNTYYAFSKPDQVHLIYHIFAGASPRSCNPALKGCANGASPGGTDGLPATHPRHWAADTCNTSGSSGAHVHWATSLEGPWHDAGPLKMETSGCEPQGCDNHNPAPWIFDNGTVLMIGRSRDQHWAGREHLFGHNLWLYRADSWNATYHWVPSSGVNGSLNIGNGTRGDLTEDPTLWKGRRGFHALLHSDGDLSHAWSHDGIKWDYSSEVMGPAPGAGGPNERPRVLLDGNGDLQALFVGQTPLAGSDASRTAAYAAVERHHTSSSQVTRSAPLTPRVVQQHNASRTNISNGRPCKTTDGPAIEAQQPEARGTTISNVRPRTTVDGSIVNAHDGMFQASRFPDGRYWLFGTHYQNCTDFSACTFPCGWENNTYAAYSSPTLGMSDWRLESADILPAVHADNSYTYYFEPAVLFCDATNQYVLSWCHGGNCAGPGKSMNIPIAVASQPQGPYTPVTPWKTQHNAGSTQGTWRDPDTGIAYVRYNSDHGNCIEELSSDFLTTTGNFTCTGAYGEGGGMFKRGSNYYLMTALGCCFCPAGGDAEVWVSRTGPLGNYTYSSQANPNLKPPPQPPRPFGGNFGKRSVAPWTRLDCNLTGDWAVYELANVTKWILNLTLIQRGDLVQYWDGKYLGGNGTVAADHRSVLFGKLGRAFLSATVGVAKAPECTEIRFPPAGKTVWAKAPWLPSAATGPSPTPPPPPPGPQGPLCELAGVWAAYTVGPPAKWQMNLTAKQNGDAVSFFDGPYPVNGTVRSDGTVIFPTDGIATIAAFNSSAPPCTKLIFGSVESPSGIWGRSPWLQFPDFSHPLYRVPAQQFGVLSLPLADGSTEHLFFGERWPDANRSGVNAPPGGTKASGWQALVPLEFSQDGEVLPMQSFETTWAEFTLNLAPLTLKSDETIARTDGATAAHIYRADRGARTDAIQAPHNAGHELLTSIANIVPPTTPAGPWLPNPCLAPPHSAQLWCNASFPITARVNDMIRRMSLAEKIANIGSNAPAIASLGVSQYNWWSEGTHGISHVRNKARKHGPNVRRC